MTIEASMTRHLVRWAVVGGLALGGAVASRSSLSDVDLSAAMELWGDVLRDADEVGLHVTRASDAEEMRLGATLATRTGAMWIDSSADAARVQRVGRALTPHVRRRGIAYTFHLVEHAAHNAWAVPGGHIYVTSGDRKSVV